MLSEEVAKILLYRRAVTLNLKRPYRFASGILSPVYTDNRLLLSYPAERKKIVGAFSEVIDGKKLSFDVIAGVATGAIAWAALLAEKYGKPMIYVRSAAKGHGKENLIEGRIEKGQKVLIIEDLVSTGGSSIVAVRGVRDAGGEVVACLAIFSYEMDTALKTFAESECELITLTTFSSLLDVAEKQKYITGEEVTIAKEWSRAPSSWGQSMGFE
ncbi:MAG: orotate phosphoribosyltransferase [Candidatus Woesearchaeota archaeon]